MEPIAPVAVGGGILLIYIIVVFGWFILQVLTTLWAMSDAASRGRSGCLVAIFVFVTWPIGLIAWIVFRPDPR